MTEILESIAASQATSKLYLNEKFSDVHFVFNVDGEVEKVPAHKIILAVLSPVFDAMFFGSLTEGREVKITDADAESFKEFLQFFYLSKVNVSVENIETIARLADKYDVLEYVRACAHFLKSKLKPANMCWGYQLALFFQNQELMDFCAENIGRSPKKVFASESFQQCELETLEHILKLDLTCTEADIFKACITWAKHSCEQNDLDANKTENLKIQLGDCLKLIRFGEMTIGDLTEILSTNKELFNIDEFQDIFFMVSMKGYTPKIFNQKPRSYVWNEKNILECKRTAKPDNPIIQNIQSQMNNYYYNIRRTYDNNSRRNPNNYPYNNGYNSGYYNTPQLVNYHHIPTPPSLIDTSKRVLPTEVVSFTSNQPMLLGQFSTQWLSSPNLGENLRVTITEIEDHFSSTEARKVLYNAVCKMIFLTSIYGEQFKVKLEQPIFIKPQVIYEICLKFMETSINATYDSTFQPTEEFGNGRKIRFHPNNDDSSNDFIETLCFNRL